MKIKRNILANIKSMKKVLKFFILFLFFNIFLFDVKIFGGVCFSFFESDYCYEICHNDKTYNFKDSDFKLKLSKIQSQNYHSLETLKKLKQTNFSEEEVLNYVFPEINEIFEKVSKNFEKPEIQGSVFVKPNKCELEFVDGEIGKVVNKQKFFSDCFSQIIDNKKLIKLNLEIIDYKTSKNIRNLFSEKSCFSTGFYTSSSERKNNIQVALKALDGIVVDEGEVFSFNEITGERNEKAGYKQAKIISGGAFVSGIGGGVCQVSTTLYNACLLSDLEIIEATSHSLPISYVEPSFDAMVSFGSSDLKVRNNSGGKIIITTSSENDICKIKIFGLKNKYKITRQSEKVSIIPAEKEIIDTDYKKHGDYELEVGEEKRISYAKDGFVSRGYLSYYDEKGQLVKHKKFRENRYNPTKGIVIKREK